MPPAAPSFWHSFIREPLVHFVLLGGLVFAAEYALRARQGDPNEIVVSPEVESEARKLFRTARGREPTPDELRVLRERWVDNEVLYREGLALRLEQGDPTLRERIIFKALNVIESNLRIPAADDATLRAFFEQHRSQYDAPGRVDFSEAIVKDGDVQRFAAALNGGAAVDVQSGLRIFKDRPIDSIRAAFGPAFVTEVERVSLREWHVLPSTEGARVVRVEARESAEAADFDSVRTRVAQDWRDAKAEELRSAAVRELGKKYTVRVAGSSS